MRLDAYLEMFITPDTDDFSDKLFLNGRLAPAWPLIVLRNLIHHFSTSSPSVIIPTTSRAAPRSTTDNNPLVTVYVNGKRKVEERKG